MLDRISLFRNKNVYFAMIRKLLNFDIGGSRGTVRYDYVFVVYGADLIIDCRLNFFFESAFSFPRSPYHHAT